MKKLGICVMVLICSFVLAMTFAGQVRAQESQTAVQAASAQAGTSMAQAGVDRKIDPSRLAALKAKIEKLKYEKLRTTLGMDDAQAKQFFAIYKPAEQDIQGLVQKRNADILKLQQISSGAGNSADADATLTEIHDLTGQIGSRQQSLDQSLKSVLSPKQRAQLLVFEQAFNKKVGEALQKHRVEKNIIATRRKLKELRKERQLLKQQLKKQ